MPPGRPHPPGALTTQEVADVLGVSWETVTRWWQEGLLTEVEAPKGRRPRFFAREEAELLAAEFAAHPRPRQWQGLDLTGVADGRLRDRFWLKVDANGDCWPWREYCNEDGYGQFVLRRGVLKLAHVVSYALTKGPVPPRAYVCHHCDNPPCVRPEHLFLGTADDNNRDMFTKGRQGSRHPGSERENARLTEADVAAIRAVPYYYGRTAALARQYGVSATTIRKVLDGSKWRHVA